MPDRYNQWEQRLILAHGFREISVHQSRGVGHDGTDSWRGTIQAHPHGNGPVVSFHQEGQSPKSAATGRQAPTP